VWKRSNAQYIAASDSEKYNALRSSSTDWRLLTDDCHPVAATVETCKSYQKHCNIFAPQLPTQSSGEEKKTENVNFCVSYPYESLSGN